MNSHVHSYVCVASVLFHTFEAVVLCFHNYSFLLSPTPVYLVPRKVFFSLLKINSVKMSLPLWWEVCFELFLHSSSSSMSIIPNIILYNYYPILITWRCNRNYLALTISPNKLDLNDISITTLYYKTFFSFYFILFFLNNQHISVCYCNIFTPPICWWHKSLLCPMCPQVLKGHYSEILFKKFPDFILIFRYLF